MQAKQAWHNISAELENQKDVTQRALAALTAPPAGAPVGAGSKGQSSSSREVGVLVSEMAKYRGDASRLEVELVSANHRCDLLEARLREANAEVPPPSLLLLLLLDVDRIEVPPHPLLCSALRLYCVKIDAALNRIQELEVRNESAEMTERAARKDAMEMRAAYEGGLVGQCSSSPAPFTPSYALSIAGEEAEALRKEAANNAKKVSELEVAVTHLREMAEIATQQAQTLSDFRDNYEVSV